MKKKWKIAILVLTAVIIVGGVATYLFTIGPLGKPVLAAVNGEKIPVARFQEELGKIDPAARDLVKEDPGKLLDVIVNRTLLLQQAKKEGVAAPKGVSATPPAAGARRGDCNDHGLSRKENGGLAAGYVSRDRTDL